MPSRPRGAAIAVACAILLSSQILRWRDLGPVGCPYPRCRQGRRDRPDRPYRRGRAPLIWRAHTSVDLTKKPNTKLMQAYHVGVSFDVAAEAYDRFMGRYSHGLSAQLADLAGVRPGQRVVDVGCGPGALVGELAARLGAESVSAVDPSEPFVLAARQRHPGVDVRRGSAEGLPFADCVFDAALAQLVVHFMQDPIAGIREMARITRPAGVVAACVWVSCERWGPAGHLLARRSRPRPNDPR